ncbi:MAG: helix-turn-helix transcriptional regulator [Chloroflexia bacterium]
MTSISARVLGQRIRQLRTRRGLTQQDLAGTDYSKSYISAIEQGKSRPSLEALQRMAARLDVPAGTLLDPDAQGFVPFDPEALPRRVRRRRNSKGGAGGRVFDFAQTEYRLVQAELLLATGRPVEALAMLRTMLPEERITEEGFTGNLRVEDIQFQRIYSLASRAATGMGESNEAVRYAQTGMQVCLRLGDRDGLVRMRNIAGLALYHANQPLAALEHHRTCLEAVTSGTMRDPIFKLEVYGNIAADYAALHDNKRTIEAYESALPLLDEVNGIERQVSIFQEVATGYAEREDFDLARVYAMKALNIYEAQANMASAARMESKYGDILVESGELEQAEERLSRSLQVAEKQKSDVDRAVALTSMARLYMKREDFDKAFGTAMQAVEISRNASYAQSDQNKGRASKRVAEEVSGYMQPQPYTGMSAHRTLAQALALSGEIASQTGDAKKTDSLFDEALQIIESNQAVDISSDIYQRYAHVLASRGQHEQASKYFELAYKRVTNRTM